MFLNNYMCVKISITGVALLLAATAAAQSGLTVQPEVISAAAGPNSTYSVAITLKPTNSGEAISGFDFTIGYSSQDGTLTSAEDNTGQPGSAMEYTLSAESPLSGVSYANIYKHVQGTTSFDLMSPDYLVKLNFQTKASFQTGDDFPVYLNKHPLEGPTGGLYDENFQTLPATYLSLEPTSSVQNWTLY